MLALPNLRLMPSMARIKASDFSVLGAELNKSCCAVPAACNWLSMTPALAYALLGW